MNLRPYAVCRVCAELYPSSRGCPTCDRDRVAAMEVAAARRSLASRAPGGDGAAALDAPPQRVTALDPWHRRRTRPLMAALSLGLLFGTVLLVFFAQA
jgi:hypothetical protein